MSSQEPDLVIYRRRRYELVGINGGQLFDPTEHGVVVTPTRTSCYRGFICTYVIKARRLLLREVSVCVDPDILAEKHAPLLGRLPVVNEGSFPPVVYQRLELDMPFSGGLLLARDQISEFYIHMGFQPSWTYRHLHELIFTDGLVVEERDCSGAAEEVRQKIRPEDMQFGREGVVDWIEKRFRLNY